MRENTDKPSLSDFFGDNGLLDELDLESFAGFAGFEEPAIKTRYCLPKLAKPVPAVYENARKLALKMPLGKGTNLFCIVGGNFIFGDLIEAIIIERELLVNSLWIQTLSLSQNNVDSLKTLSDAL